MSKKSLLLRIETLEACLGRYIQRIEFLEEKIRYLEELSYQSDRTSN